ncbi:opioid growth factor receptor isoform 2-T2 [Discoglossus pictus]
MSGDSEGEWDPEYDSTWEEEEEEDEAPTRREGRKHIGYSRSYRAARDLQNYRRGYPNLQEFNSSHMPNLEFYRNEKPFEPSGVTIEDLLATWKDDYDLLEENHCYIQWLFPLRENGMNWHAKPLTKREITKLKEDNEVRRRFLEAYKLMLGFYGIRLLNEKTGEVERADNWQDRFGNLNYHSHNNLRITRILKCLGELGFQHFQAPLVRFFLTETLCNYSLSNVKSSALDYFMFTVRDKRQRQELVHFAWEHFKPQNKFVWGPLEKLRAYKKHEENGAIERSVTTEKEENKLDNEEEENQLEPSVDGKNGNEMLASGHRNKRKIDDKSQSNTLDSSPTHLEESIENSMDRCNLEGKKSRIDNKPVNEADQAGDNELNTMPQNAEQSNHVEDMTGSESGLLSEEENEDVDLPAGDKKFLQQRAANPEYSLKEGSIEVLEQSKEMQGGLVDERKGEDHDGGESKESSAEMAAQEKTPAALESAPLQEERKESLTLLEGISEGSGDNMLQAEDESPKKDKIEEIAMENSPCDTASSSEGVKPLTMEQNETPRMEAEQDSDVVRPENSKGGELESISETLKVSATVQIQDTVCQNEDESSMDPDGSPMDPDSELSEETPL